MDAVDGGGLLHLLETQQLDQMVREAEDALAKETLDFD